MALKLYTHPLSRHSHRVVLFASLLGLKAEIVTVDLAAGAHKQPDFLKKNAFGQVPVLEYDDVVLADSNAILVYLAKKHGRDDWLPESPKEAAAVQRWLSVAAGQLAFGAARARLITVFNAPYDAEAAIALGHALLKIVESDLSAREWLAGERPTIADVALYSYLTNAPEGNVDLAPYAAVRRWLARIEALPGFVPFQQTAAGLRA